MKMLKVRMASMIRHTQRSAPCATELVLTSPSTSTTTPTTNIHLRQ